jgi:5S rRNA maturation endonuclease (ribonuclease M5)
MAPCPAHDDGTPSLSITTSAEGKTLLHCFAGCGPREILDALGLDWDALFPPGRDDERADDTWTPRGPAAAIYDYTDEQGKLLYQVLRVEPPGGKKTFLQRQPADTGGWRWTLKGVQPTLYRLPRVLKAIEQGGTVWIVEGEKDVHTAERLGLTATTNSGGAGKWPQHTIGWFSGAQVRVVADADEPGRAHARRMRAVLEAAGASVRVFEPAENCKDLTEHIASGRDVGELREVSDSPLREHGLITLRHLITGPEPEYDWLVEGLIERGERLMITASEGCGKSTWLRQFATLVAAGVHPTVWAEDPTIVHTEPRRVLWVDAENTVTQNKRHFTRLHDAAVALGRPVPDDGMLFAIRPQGLDLTDPDDSQWLYDRLAIAKPDLLVIGPWYRLFTSDPNDEKATRRIISILDDARARYNFTLVMEAHSPHAATSSSGASFRPLRPIGSSVLLRWPEYGYGLQTPLDETPGQHSTANFVPWRGSRDQRPWPPAYTRGTHLPWLATRQVVPLR